MKKAGIFAAILITTVLVMAFRSSGDGYHSSVFKYTSGGPIGYSGDPASDFLNCTYCHSGVEVQTDTAWITSDIPGSGYLPNTTYAITATATRSGVEKFGFQISPQNSEGTFLGTMASADSETALTSDTNYITHTSEGTAGSGTKSWTFNWTAPDPGSGELTLYGAFNLTNSDGRSSGDTVVLSSLAINESTVGINELTESNKGIKLYPNPASNLITFESDYKTIGSTYHVIDIAGRHIMTGEISNQSTVLIIDHFEPGMYYLHIGQQGDQAFQVVK